LRTSTPQMIDSASRRPHGGDEAKHGDTEPQ
jgi:hypothetical protein